MPQVFVRELCRQRDLAQRSLDQARGAGDDFGAQVWEQQLDHLLELAARNGVADVLASQPA